MAIVSCFSALRFLTAISNWVQFPLVVYLLLTSNCSNMKHENITRFCFCLKAVPCSFFKLIFYFQISVSYSQLVQFSLQRAHDSIRKAIAGISKVSPLRISDLHVSFTDQMIPKWSTLDLKFKNSSVSWKRF